VAAAPAEYAAPPTAQSQVLTTPERASAGRDEDVIVCPGRVLQTAGCSAPGCRHPVVLNRYLGGPLIVLCAEIRSPLRCAASWRPHLLQCQRSNTYLIRTFLLVSLLGLFRTYATTGSSMEPGWTFTLLCIAEFIRDECRCCCHVDS
jgi:hypothetical protein